MKGCGVMQGNVTIATSVDTLDIKYGSVESCEREAARTSVKYIFTDICDLQKSYIRLGFHLYEFRSNEYYKDFGYLTFEDFCENNIGLDKGSISRCINVYFRFAKKNDSLVPGMFIDDRYACYSYSQLCEMLPLNDNDLKVIKPDMTVKQIREYKKSKKGTCYKKVIGQSCDVATDKKVFELEKFKVLKGAVARNYVKKCMPVGSCPVLLFDLDGKPVECRFDILANDRNGIVLRWSKVGVE